MSLDTIKEEELFNRTEFFVCDNHPDHIDMVMKFTFLNAKATGCEIIYGFDYAGRPTLTWEQNGSQGLIARLP